MSTNSSSFHERFVDITVRPVSDIEHELRSENLSENRRKLLQMELEAAHQGIDSFRTIERLEAVTLSSEDYARNAQAHLEKLQAIHDILHPLLSLRGILLLGVFLRILVVLRQLLLVQLPSS